MERAVELMRAAKLAGLELWLHDGALRFRFAGTPPPALMASLRQHREELHELLRGRANASRVALTLPQRQLWALAMLSRGGQGAVAYNEGLAVDVSYRMSRQRVEDALRTLHHRHPQLRAEVDGDGRQQWIWPSTHVQVECLEASEDTRVAVAEAAALATMARPFEFDQPPQLQAVLVRDREGSTLALFSHHCFVDGAALVSLLREMLGLVAEWVEPQEEDELPTLEDYVTYRERSRQSQAAARARDHWRSVLTSIESAALVKVGSGFAAERSYLGGRVQQWFSDAWPTLEQIAQHMGVGPFALLMSIAATACARLGSGRDVLFAISMDARPAAQCQGLVGYCSEVYPVLMPAASERSLAELAKLAQVQMMKLFALQAISWADLADSNVARMPAVSAALTLLDVRSIAESEPRVRRVFPVPCRFRDTPLAFEVLRHPGDSFEVCVDYVDEAVGESLARAVLGEFVRTWTLLGFGALEELRGLEW